MAEAKKDKTKLALATAPRKASELPWWDEYYTDRTKIRDRELFA
jgi:ribosomal protein L39E